MNKLYLHMNGENGVFRTPSILVSTNRTTWKGSDTAYGISTIGVSEDCDRDTADTEIIFFIDARDREDVERHQQAAYHKLQEGGVPAKLGNRHINVAARDLLAAMECLGFPKSERVKLAAYVTGYQVALSREGNRDMVPEKEPVNGWPFRGYRPKRPRRKKSNAPVPTNGK